MKKHILVISQYFFPEQFRINDICTEWVNKGYKVTVITGIPNYPQGEYFEGYGIFKKRKEAYNGVNIIRIPLIPRGNNSIMLALNYLSFVISGFFWMLFTKIKADYVFIFEVSPMSQALPGVWYAKKRSIPCYLYVQDLWPENVKEVAGIDNKKILMAIGRMVDYIYARCTKIFTTSKSFIHSIAERGVNREKIEYWPQYAEEFYKPLTQRYINEIPYDGSFNIVFAGNIGKAQGLEILPEVASMLSDKPLKRKVRFNIIGDGRFKDELIEIVKQNGVRNSFNFIERQPATKIPEYFSSSDVAFISLSKSPLFSKTIPAKLQSYLACGIPIIACAEGETKKIIKEANAGTSCMPGSVPELARIITEMSNKSNKEIKDLGDNARSYYLENFEKNKLLNRMDKYFSV